MKERFDRSKPHITIGTIGKESTMSNEKREDVELKILGESGESACLVLSKKALVNIHQKGATYPLELVVNGKKMKIVVMRDRTYENRMRIFKKANEEAMEVAKKAKESNKGTGLDLVE